MNRGGTDGGEGSGQTLDCEKAKETASIGLLMLMPKSAEPVWKLVSAGPSSPCPDQIRMVPHNSSPPSRSVGKSTKQPVGIV